MQETKRIKNPRKQRKMLYNAPAHLRHKLMSAPLSRELASSKGAKSLPVRRGDTILIKRGDNKGFEGKVSRVDLKAYRIYVEGLTREKVDGTNIFLPIHPSKVEIRNLNLDDKWRKDILGRKKEIEKPEKPEKAKAKLPAKKVKEAPAKVEEAKEEKIIEPEEQPTVAKEEEAMEVAEQVPAVEKVTEEVAPEPKKASAKKTIAKKSPRAKKAKTPALEEKVTAAKKTVTKPKGSKKKEAKKTEEKEAAPKAKAKKTSDKGGQ